MQLCCWKKWTQQQSEFYLQSSKKMLKSICDEEEPEVLINSSQVLLLYLSTSECQVCKALKPKLEKLLSLNFPLIRTFFLDIEKFPRSAARLSVLTVPTLVIFFEGKETIRKSRFINLDELRKEIERPYLLYFLEKSGLKNSF
jgi:thioredoxin 1